MTTKQEVHVSVLELMKIIVNEVENENNDKVPFINITMETDFKDWVKKCKEDGSINPFWKQVTKETTRRVLPVVNYKKRVEKNMGKEGIEGEHELGEMKGKKHLTRCLLTDIETETKFYIMVEVFDEVTPTETIYRHNGNEIDKTMFQKWITYYKNYTSQQQERKVKVITPLLTNLKGITINGTRYLLMK